jgi:4-hydroxybenzoate polyprenyltransferase
MRTWLSHPVSRVAGEERPVADFVFRSRIHMLPAAALIFWAVPPWYGAVPAWNAAPSVLLACFGIYQLNRVYDAAEDSVNAPAAFARDEAARGAIRGTGVCALVLSVLLSAVLLNARATVVLLAMIGFGAAYSVPFLARADGKPVRLKQLAWLKNAVPSVVWPVVTVIYPAMAGPAIQLPLLMVVVGAVASSIFTIEVAWDVRDAPGDKAAGIGTLTTAFGATRALLVPLVVSGAGAIAIAVLVGAGVYPAVYLFPAALLVALPLTAFLWKEALTTDRDRSQMLVLLNIIALVPLGLIGRWMV